MTERKTPVRRFDLSSTHSEPLPPPGSLTQLRAICGRARRALTFNSDALGYEGHAWQSEARAGGAAIDRVGLRHTGSRD